MMFRYSMRRNFSAVSSPMAVSIASFMLLKLGARFRAGFSALEMKLSSVSVNSISSLNFRWPIMSRIWSVVSCGMNTDARFLMNAWMISVSPTIDSATIVQNTGSMLLRMMWIRFCCCFLAGAAAGAAWARADPAEKASVQRTPPRRAAGAAERRRPASAGGGGATGMGPILSPAAGTAGGTGWAAPAGRAGHRRPGRTRPAEPQGVADRGPGGPPTIRRPRAARDVSPGGPPPCHGRGLEPISLTRAGPQGMSAGPRGTGRRPAGTLSLSPSSPPLPRGFPPTFFSWQPGGCPPRPPCSMSPSPVRKPRPCGRPLTRSRADPRLTCLSSGSP